MTVDLFDDDTTSGRPMGLLGVASGRVPRVASWAAATTQGAHRSNNQDAFAQLGSVFAVADGMGGLADGRQAADLAAREAVYRWQAFSSAEAVRTFAREINEQVLAIGSASGQRVGTTLVAAHVEEGRVTILSVGDSRAYRLRDGSLELLTRDHNLRGELLDAGISPQVQNAGGPLRALTSYVGQSPEEFAVDIRSIALVPGDRLLLCSDGVHGVYSHHEIAAIVGSGTPHECTQQLASSSVPSGADDATAIVIEITTDESSLL